LPAARVIPFVRILEYQTEARVYLRRIATIVAGAAAGIALMSTAASAHECFIASRSANGKGLELASDVFGGLLAAGIAACS
jgi:hypothetical protein